nr:uncharacterized protein LOC124224766 [Neodiprion pinetum]
MQTCTQANTDTPHPPQIVTHPPTVTQTTRTTATHTTTHPPTKKQTPHTTTRPTPTPTPRHTLPPASPPQWAHTRFARPQTTEDRILQTFANMDRHTEPTQTKQTYKKHTGPPPEIIAIIANLQSASTLDDELRAQRERYMTRRTHERTNTDETEASTSTRQPHTTHQTAPHKTQPPNTPDTDSDTDSTTSTAKTVIHIETTHTSTPQTQTTDNDTNKERTKQETLDKLTTPNGRTNNDAHTTRDAIRYKKGDKTENTKYTNNTKPTDEQRQTEAKETEHNPKREKRREKQPRATRYKEQRKNSPRSTPTRATEPKPKIQPDIHCGKFGHKISECRSRSLSTIPDNFENLSKKIPSTAVKSSVTCFKCREVGHVSTNCKKSSGSEQNTLVQGQMERRVNSCSIQPTFGDLLHSGEKFSFCFDSGAECSLIKESIAKKLSGKRQNFVVILCGIGSSSIQSVTQILAQVTMNNHCLEILFHVIHDDFLITEILLGREILTLGYSIEMTVDSLVLKRIPRINVCEVDSHSFNFDEMKTDVSELDKRLLVDVLNKFRSTFVKGTPKSRVTTGQLEFRLLDHNRTVQRRPYRLSTVERQIVRDKIKELQEENIIRPSYSPFASPIILVKKKDGSDIMCVDYPELNNNTVAVTYPLPLIADQIDRLGGAYYFTSLDMASGFRQIPIHPDSIERTAFVTPDGQ